MRNSNFKCLSVSFGRTQLQHFNTSTHYRRSPGRRLSLHSKKLRLTWSANHLVRGGTSDLFPSVLGVLDFNTPTLQHFNTLSEVAWRRRGIFHRRAAEIRRFFLGDHQDGCLCTKHPRMYLRLLRTAEPGRLVGDFLCIPRNSAWTLLPTIWCVVEHQIIFRGCW